MLSTGSVFQIDLSSVKQHPEVSLSLSLQLIATEIKLSSSVCKVFFFQVVTGQPGAEHAIASRMLHTGQNLASANR